jgi:hypothetical protein
MAMPTAYTTAPEAYDGFGTTSDIVGTLDGKPLRRVTIRDEHFTWQTQRYGSGMYPAFTPEQYAELQGRPWFQAQQKENTRDDSSVN